MPLETYPLKIVVIGGGAAGFFGAIACAETFPKAKITLLEASRDLLSKVKISGGGRCNVTHACFDPAALMQNYPRGNRALRGPMTRFQPQDTIAWFKNHGVNLKTEADGRMFPVSNTSQTIVDCLLQTAINTGVNIQTSTPVRSVETHQGNPRFLITLKSGKSLECDRLLIATGSHPSGYRILKSLGHQIVSPVPSLFTFQVPDAALKNLAGISVPNAQVSIKFGKSTFQQQGPILITHWGLSGPAILKLSAWAARELQECHYKTNFRVNWLPDKTQDNLLQYFQHLKQDWNRRQLGAHNPLDCPSRLWQYWLLKSQINPDNRWADLSKSELNNLITHIQQGHFQLQGKGVFKDEFVTCGGVQLKEVNFKTLESRICPGLFIAGELLDIDGITGGFNFQNAWTTGWIAGQSMGRTD